MRLLFYCVLALFLLSPFAHAAPTVKATTAKTGSAAFSRSVMLPKWTVALDPVPVTSSVEPVVLRLAEVQYWGGANPAYLVNRAVQVNSSTKISELGQFAISFAPAYQKLVVHRIAIMRDNQVLDRTLSANIRVLDSEKEVTQGFYTGMSTAQVLLEDVKVGDTLWTTYSVEGSNPVFGTVWREQLPWTKDVPIELRKAVMLYPSSKNVQWRLSGAARPGMPEPSIERKDGITKLVFREHSLAPEEFEPSLPPDLVPFPVLDFSEYRDWGEVAQWASKLFPIVQPNPELRALAQKFSRGTAEERATQALRWVQDEIRYFSVSMGENSHRPQLPEVVLKRRFGDCKDKSLLLVSLYRAMGLQAQPVLVNSVAPKMPAQFLPSPGSFNHVVVRLQIDEKYYFVDPTLQDERGMISSQEPPVPGAAALLVASDVAGLIVLPEVSMDEPFIDRREQIIVPGLHGVGQLKLHLEFRGRFAAGMRQFYRSLSSSELKKLILGQYERTYPDVQLDGAPKLSDGNDGASFIVEAQFVVPKILKEENGSFLLAQRSHVLEGTVGMPEKVVRKYPFWMSAGRYRSRYTLDASLPNEARLMKSDDRVDVKNDYFAANAQLTWRGAQLNYYVDYVIKNPEVAPAEMAKLVQEVEKLTPLIESKLRFKPVIASPEAAKAASLRVLDILEKVTSFEDLQIEALRTGKPPEFKFEESTYAKLNYRALCELAIDTYSVRKWNPLVGAPMAAIYKLVDARADQRTKDLCYARIDIVDRNLPRASKSLAALAPADDDVLTLMQAWADFHANDGAKSKVNLKRFLKAKSSGGTLGIDDTLLAAALSRRLGIEEPLEIAHVIESLRAGAWPRPLFEFYRGKLSPDELLVAVEGLPFAAREQSAMEAHFLISQHLLATRKAREAAFHLNWIGRNGIVGSAFSVLADADKYGDARANADMLAVWKQESEGIKNGSIVRHLKAAAESGVAVAQSKLGSRYMEGTGVLRDLAKAQALLEEASDQGDTNATHDLALIYLSKEPGFNDEARAVAYFRKAAEHGNAFGGLSMGKAYFFGEYGLPVDYEQAFRYMKIGAELEQTEAQFFLSRMYYEGKGVEKNDSLAKFWAGQAHLRKRAVGTAQLGMLLFFLETDSTVRLQGLKMLAGIAANNGCYAQQQLGKILLEGAGIQANLPDAARWLKLAHECEFDEASALLGRLYVEGNGVTQDIARGMKMLAELEKRNAPDAFFQLGTIHLKGIGNIADKPKAAEYFRRGADRGQRHAAEALAVMLHTGDGIPQDKAKAAEYYEVAIKSGLSRALNNLANMYMDGDGVRPDAQKAMMLFRRASQGGHSMAMMTLGEVYESNQQGKENILLPLAYYMLAARFGEEDAKAAVERVRNRADQATIDKAQAYALAWKPGKAMPEEI